jgi:hypothetical protein
MEERGLVNCYICKKCKERTFTINLNTGVTPFSILCPNCCGYECYSNFYDLRIFDSIHVSHVWYRPQKHVFDTLPSHTQDHILNGGLILGDIGCSVLYDNIDPKISVELWDEYVLKIYGKKLVRK